MVPTKPSSAARANQSRAARHPLWPKHLKNPKCLLGCDPRCFMIFLIFLNMTLSKASKEELESSLHTVHKKCIAGILCLVPPQKHGESGALALSLCDSRPCRITNYCLCSHLQSAFDVLSCPSQAPKSLPETFEKMESVNSRELGENMPYL
jgi:hypothetical protein